MIAAGIGFRAGTSAEAMADLVRQALPRAGVEASRLTVLATVAGRADDPSFLEAARLLAVAPMAVGPEAMQAVAGAVATRSDRVIALHGVGSVAEAAALWAAGRDATLLLPRIVTDTATCAVARGGGR